MNERQVFVRKKPEFDVVSRALSQKLAEAIHLHTNCIVYALYEVEGLDEKAFTTFATEILGDKVTDEITETIETIDRTVLAYTFLAGHFDQRSYYALQAGNLILDHEENFSVRSSTVVVFDSVLAQQDYKRIKDYLINPVDTRQRSLHYEKLPEPFQKEIQDISNFNDMDTAELQVMTRDLGLTMDIDTLCFIQNYYRKQAKKATETELFLFDTYWSDHCRHTTFLTPLTKVTFSGRYKGEIEQTFKKYLKQREEIGNTKKITLMDLATHTQRYGKAKGQLERVEESEEVNACSIRVSDEHGDYLLMFKNETHNHPTEIEPFGGAQTCLGGAIRDPLSGRSFVYQGIRISGSGDPTGDINETIENKLPQSTIARESARGFSSYGNQIGMATTFVKEIYHPSYVAKHLELGAVVGITKEDEVVRASPCAGDIVVLLGGKTGKDGIGGASGSSISHTTESLDTSYAQIQKGNPLEERKLQRLFRIPAVKKMIKRSNDFGAGGVSVAIGELAPGIIIDLDAVPLKTLGMNATEIAISESQERMAVVIEEKYYDQLLNYARAENVEATRVGIITSDNHLVMKHQKETVVDIDRDFLNTNGLFSTQEVEITDQVVTAYNRDHYQRLNSYSQKGLGEIFDSSVGYSTLFAPYGGRTQSTAELSSVQRFPLHASSNRASVVSYGFDPEFTEESPYRMGMLAVLSSVAKQIATGSSLEDIYLSFQEYFPKPNTDTRKWGLVLQALLGAFEVCDALSLAAIGGKDSMSGTYEQLDVIPTLVSFAFGAVEISKLRSRAFHAPGEYIYCLKQPMSNGLPDFNAFKHHIALIEEHRHAITAISTLDDGLSHTLAIMSLGNEIGYDCQHLDNEKNHGGFVFTTANRLRELEPIGKTTAVFDTTFRDAHLAGLQSIYPITTTSVQENPPETTTVKKRYYHTRVPKPVVLILAFSGTNSEFDMEMNFSRAGGKTEMLLVQDTSHTVFIESVDRFISALAYAHILVIPGGFSFSDEPDGSGKIITAFLKNAKVREAVQRFVDKDHLILGICNGFQGLLKSGILPYGTIQERKAEDPTLFYNDTYHHIARLTRTKIHSNRSPWLQELDAKSTYILPISHSEGKFIADAAQQEFLIKNDLIATTYLDNPNGSVLNIEGIVSPNGNILGKMAHNERIGEDLFINVDGCKRQDIFTSGIRYFTNGGTR